MTYIPPHFAQNDASAMQALLRDFPLGTWVLSTADGLQAHHIPWVLDTTRGAHGTLLGHVARANTVWQELGFETLVVFQGPSAYISPNWYPSKREHGRAVPTYNYDVVHIHGVAQVVEDKAQTLAIMERLTNTFEAAQPKPWHVADAPPDYLEQMLAAIVAIEIPIDRWVGKRKASQNRSPADRAGVVQGLRESGDNAAMAHLLEKAGKVGIDPA